MTLKCPHHIQVMASHLPNMISGQFLVLSKNLDFLIFYLCLIYPVLSFFFLTYLKLVLNKRNGINLRTSKSKVLLEVFQWSRWRGRRVSLYFFWYFTVLREVGNVQLWDSESNHHRPNEITWSNHQASGNRMSKSSKTHSNEYLSTSRSWRIETLLSALITWLKD